MNNFCKKYCSRGTTTMRVIRIILLVLIVIGLGLLATTRLWVPSLVQYLLQPDTDVDHLPAVTQKLPLVATTTIPVVPTGTTATATPTTTDKTPTVPVPPVNTGSTSVDSGVQGSVTIGPVCPVEQNPPAAACASRPYPTTLVLASTMIGRNGGVLMQTDATGHFTHPLAPGTYTIRAQGTNTPPTLTPQTFTIVAHQWLTLNLQFDSGIR